MLAGVIDLVALLVQGGGGWGGVIVVWVWWLVSYGGGGAITMGARRRHYHSCGRKNTPLAPAPTWSVPWFFSLFLSMDFFFVTCTVHMLLISCLQTTNAWW